MSVRQMAIVWTLDLNHTDLIVLLAMADHADDEGGNVYPSVGHLAWKTGYSERQVRYILKGLRDRQIVLLEARGGEQGTVNLYRLNLSVVARKKPYRKPEEGVQFPHPPEKRTPGVQPVAGGAAIAVAPRAAIAVAPEPSVEPSVESSVESSPPTPPKGGHGLAQLWNEIIDKPKVQAVTGTRKKHADLRLSEQPDLDWWRRVIECLRDTPFLRGDNDRKWAADFDWLVRNGENGYRVLEGKYDRRHFSLQERAEQHRRMLKEATGDGGGADPVDGGLGGGVRHPVLPGPAGDLAGGAGGGNGSGGVPGTGAAARGLALPAEGGRPGGADRGRPGGTPTARGGGKDK